MDAITIRLHKELLDRIDAAAAAAYQSRADFIRQAILDRLAVRKQNDSITEVLVNAGLLKKE